MLAAIQLVWLSMGEANVDINSLRPRPNRRQVADDIFKCIFENENERISYRISLKFVPQVRINNIPALVQIMAWRRSGDKPLSEPMMVSLLTHICVTRPQWVNSLVSEHNFADHISKKNVLMHWNMFLSKRCRRHSKIQFLKLKFSWFWL